MKTAKEHNESMKSQPGLYAYTLEEAKNLFSLQRLRDQRTTSCNLCGQVFKPRYRYELFCKKCRSSDDSFQFNEWLPQLPDGFCVNY